MKNKGLFLVSLILIGIITVSINLSINNIIPDYKNKLLKVDIREGKSEDNLLLIQNRLRQKLEENNINIYNVKKLYLGDEANEIERDEIIQKCSNILKIKDFEIRTMRIWYEYEDKINRWEYIVLYKEHISVHLLYNNDLTTVYCYMDQYPEIYEEENSEILNKELRSLMIKECKLIMKKEEITIFENFEPNSIWRIQGDEYVLTDDLENVTIYYDYVKKSITGFMIEK